VCHFL